MGNIANVLNKKVLEQFTGTEAYHKYWCGNLELTDGVDYLQKNGCGWLIDAIASYQKMLANQGVNWQAWYLERKSDGSAVLKCTDGNDNRYIRQKFDWTDCPVDLTLYCIDGVLLLSSEY